MSEQPDKVIDVNLELEIKGWLRGSVLSKGTSTPLQFLFMAYRLQGGRRSASEFADVIVHRCKGLKVTKHEGKVVVHGVAPRWDAGSLTAVIQGRQT